MYKQRLSNIELLRILSIFFILVVHADFLNFGEPTPSDMRENTLVSVSKVFFETLGFVCVDVFIFISGWFGVHASFKKICKLIFQCFFLFLLLYILSLLFGWGAFSIKSFLERLVESLAPGWFIKAYLVLYIFTPVLNKFVEYSSERQLRYILITFYTVQSVYGWLFPNLVGGEATMFIHGYSTTSFAGLYLLARYWRLYFYGRQNNLSSFITNKNMFTLWILVVVMNTLLWCVTCFFNIGQIYSRILSYTSPFIIVQSVCMFMSFNTLEVKSKYINRIGASSLAVFIVHDGWFGKRPFFDTLNYIDGKYSGWTCLLIIFSFLFFVFFLSILMDQLRVLCWNSVSKYIPEGMLDT